MKIITILLLSACFFSQCTKSTVNNICDKGELKETALNWTGRVSYHSEEKAWTILYHTPGTIDAGFECIVCNIPESCKTTGKTVVFSGDLYSTRFRFSSQIAGVEIRVLELRDVK